MLPSLDHLLQLHETPLPTCVMGQYLVLYHAETVTSVH